MGMKRIDGQIWIDREAPYRLKYHINGVDYTVLVAADYTVPEAPEDEDPIVILQGMVVRDSDKGPQMIEPASFPEDIDRVLGVALNSSSYENLPEGTEDKHIAVAQTGYIVLDKPEDVSGVFALKSDIDVSQNGWGADMGEDPPGIGCPVYWYIGHTDKDYTYHDSSKQAGKITFITPSGYKYPKTPIKDDEPYDESLNVGYDNLPRIGTVVDYELDGNKIVSLTINVNFATFDSTLEWVWPGEHYDKGCGKINHKTFINEELSPLPGESEESKKTAKNEIIIRHGLFVDRPGKIQVVNYSNVVASDSSDKSGSIYNIQTRAANYTSDTDKRTVFDINTPEDLYYRISGTVHYNFDRNHDGE